MIFKDRPKGWNTLLRSSGEVPINLHSKHMLKIKRYLGKKRITQITPSQLNTILTSVNSKYVELGS